jgi:diguanylate cyclase (GGDEF)-like protein
MLFPKKSPTPAWNRCLAYVGAADGGNPVKWWKRMTLRQLRLLRLDRVRNRIVAFAVLATLIPTVTLAWVSYLQSRRALTEKISSELVGVSSQAAHEIDLWLKERLYDLRVFSNSYEVSENLQRLLQAARDPSPRIRLADYLNSVRDHFADYRELGVFDRRGQLVATSPSRTSHLALPPKWEETLRTDNVAIGVPRWDKSAHAMVVVVAVPIQPPGGQLVGTLAAKLSLADAHEVLLRFADGHRGRALLVSEDGRLIASSSLDTGTVATGRLAATTIQALSTEPFPVLEYENHENTAVLGTFRAVTRAGWGVVAELARADGYAQVTRLRNVTALVLGLLIAVVGMLAYLLGRVIVEPLDRLSAGATQVAGGNLEVRLPIIGGGELAYLTEVFNNMVGRLRQDRRELDEINEQLREKNALLERLSFTDPLTGLFNRRHLFATLESEVRRASRHNRALSVLIMDVDLFKTYNDAFGHQAGDEALIKVASVLRASLREVDCAARYGGEEFVVLLPDTGIEQALEVTDRIRAKLAVETFTGGQITLSIGIAEFPDHGASAESLIACADGALYHAKRQGRDRVVRADWASTAANKAGGR